MAVNSMGRSHDWRLFENEETTEIHHKDCPECEDRIHTGDASAVGVESAPDDEFDKSCKCLDPLLGSER